MGICAICKGSWPSMHEHHVIPREFGGEKGPTVMLCPSCHNSLHQQANHWMAGKNELEFFPEEIMPQAEPFIQLIMKASLRFKDLDDSGKPGKLLTVKLHDPSLLVKLHKLKADKGFTNLEKFMNAIIARLTAGY